MVDEVLSRMASPPPSPQPNDGIEFLDLEGKSATDGNLVVELREKVESSGSQAPVPRTRKQIVAGNIHYFALCFSFFLLGWNDGSIGPLLPRIQRVYGVRHSQFMSTGCTSTCTGRYYRSAMSWCLFSLSFPAWYAFFRYPFRQR